MHPGQRHMRGTRGDVEIRMTANAVIMVKAVRKAISIQKALNSRCFRVGRNCVLPNFGAREEATFDNRPARTVPILSGPF